MGQIIGSQNWKPYKSFVALITQLGVNDPTLIILENEFGASVTASRWGVGSYDITFSNIVFPDINKVAIIFGQPCTDQGSGTFPMVVQPALYDPLQANALYFITYDPFSPVDGSIDTCLYNTFLEIRVYK